MSETRASWTTVSPVTDTILGEIRDRLPTLRDLFAAHVAGFLILDCDMEEQENREAVAEEAFKIADALLAEREKKP